jgi:DNA-binding MarR family transcriptional regulator
MEDILKDLRVSAPEAHMLSFIGLYGPSSVGELVRVFGYRKPTMTSMLNKLEQRGYLVRQLNPEDRRSLLIRLQPEGEKIAGEARRRVEDLDADIIKRVSASDMAGFQNVLNAVAKITGVEVRKTTPSNNPGNNTKE